jgi:S1-C subfamily serine protease
VLKKLLLAAVIAATLFFYPKAAAQPSSRPSDVGQYLLTEKYSQVLMLTPPSRFNTGGTGFSIRAPSGRVYTLTNKHICELAEGGKLAAHIPGTARWVPINVIYKAETTDLCLLDAIPGASGLTLATNPHLTERLFVMGHPYLNPLTISEGYTVGRTVFELSTDIQSKAECTAPNQVWKQAFTIFGPIMMCVEQVDTMDTSIPIFPGNSGSPVFAADGEVVGIVYAADSRTNRGGYIPLDIVWDFLNVY